MSQYGTHGMFLWGFQALVGMTVALTAWNLNREVNRADRHDSEISVIQRDITRIDTTAVQNKERFDVILSDLREIKTDIKRLTRDRIP